MSRLTSTLKITSTTPESTMGTTIYASPFSESVKMNTAPVASTSRTNTAITTRTLLSFKMRKT